MPSSTKWHLISFKLESFQNSGENPIYADFCLHTTHKERLAKQMKDARGTAGSALTRTLEFSIFNLLYANRCQGQSITRKNCPLFPGGPRVECHGLSSPETARPVTSLPSSGPVGLFSVPCTSPAHPPSRSLLSLFCEPGTLCPPVSLCDGFLLIPAPSDQSLPLKVHAFPDCRVILHQTFILFSS